MILGRFGAAAPGLEDDKITLPTPRPINDPSEAGDWETRLMVTREGCWEPVGTSGNTSVDGFFWIFWHQTAEKSMGISLINDWSKR